MLNPAPAYSGIRPSLQMSRTCRQEEGRREWVGGGGPCGQRRAHHPGCPTQPSAPLPAAASCPARSAGRRAAGGWPCRAAAGPPPRTQSGWPAGRPLAHDAPSTLPSAAPQRTACRSRSPQCAGRCRLAELPPGTGHRLQRERGYRGWGRDKTRSCWQGQTRSCSAGGTHEQPSSPCSRRYASQSRLAASSGG